MASPVEAGFFLSRCFRDVGRATHIRGSFEWATDLTDIAEADWFTIWLYSAVWFFHMYKLSLWASEILFHCVCVCVCVSWGENNHPLITVVSQLCGGWWESLIKHKLQSNVDSQLLSSVSLPGNHLFSRPAEHTVYPLLSLPPDSWPGSGSSLPAAPEGVSLWPLPYSRGRGGHRSRVQDLQGFRPGTLREWDVHSQHLPGPAGAFK